MIAKKNYQEKALMKKTLKMHEESSSRRKTDEDVQEGAVPAYLLDRENTSLAKVLSNTIKQKRKEKAGKWDVPLPKVRPVAEDEIKPIIGIPVIIWPHLKSLQLFLVIELQFQVP